jgi:hypothetical protein
LAAPAWLSVISALGAEPARPTGGGMFIPEKAVAEARAKIIEKTAERDTARLERGLAQVARLWREEDGTAEQFVQFCAEHYAAGAERDELFARFEENLEAVGGHFLGLSLQLRRHFDEERGPLLPLDHLLTAWDAGAHVNEDLFATKIAFAALLNFPPPSFEEVIASGERWSRRQWAEARLGQRFAHRVPGSVQQALAKAYAQAEAFTDRLNIRMDKVVGPDGKPLFREGLRLLSHWGLRDELKALYADPKKNLPLQRIILTIMERIIRQEIPDIVVDNDKVSWDPVANTVDGKSAPRMPDTRYERLLGVFRAHQLENPYYPDAPTHVDRRFRLNREIPEKDVQALFEAVLRAPVGKEVAALIEKRLGRRLEPFDIWYDGFKARAAFDERELDRRVAAEYPDAAAFERAIPKILRKLGFDPVVADFVGAHVKVDPARGSGHAWGPGMRGDDAHLRTRVPAGGMNYKGFNIAMHELGHNTEQVLSLYNLDHTLLQGVPNTAFTEGFAFVFQARDLWVLGIEKPDPAAEALRVLDDFWMTREIAGVGLLDMKVWRWMLAHPEASPAELREAVVKIAKEIWNDFYAPVLGVKDSPILAIYSHMVSNGLYLPDYPLGHIIAFQVEDYFKTHPLGKEMVRLCSQGSVAPNVWMKQGVGQPISAEPMLKSARAAVAELKKKAR